MTENAITPGKFQPKRVGPKPGKRKFLSTEQVARKLKLAESTIRKYIAQGYLAAEVEQAGRRRHYRVTPEALDAFLVLRDSMLTPAVAQPTQASVD